MRRTFKMLREVQLNIRIEKVNTYERVMVKALLDSRATGIFINKKMAEKHGFRLQKLERSLKVRNMNRTRNSRKNIMYQIEVNVFYKNYVERIRIDMYNLGKTEVILGILWLQAYNPKYNN